MSLSECTALITSTIKPELPGVVVCTSSDKLRPALTAGKIAAWVGAPASIRLDTETIGVAEYEIALISPEAARHLAGIETLARLAHKLAPPLAVTQLKPDTATLGQGPTYPALFLTFEVPYTIGG